jgi:hypothetical protein
VKLVCSFLVGYLVSWVETPRTAEYAIALCPPLTACKRVGGQKIEFRKSCLYYKKFEQRPISCQRL